MHFKRESPGGWYVFCTSRSPGGIALEPLAREMSGTPTPPPSSVALAPPDITDLIDSHHRHMICQVHNLPYRIDAKDFTDRAHQEVEQ